MLNKRPHGAQSLDKWFGRAIENGDLGTVQFNEAVVDPQGTECRHEVLDGGDLHAVGTSQHGAALRKVDAGGQGSKGGSSLEVGAAELEAEVHWSWLNGQVYVGSRMKSLALERGLTCYGCLFFHEGEMVIYSSRHAL